MELLSTEGGLFLLRWLHFLAGITWIGVLYYFNFIQTPFFGSELGGTARSAMMRGLVPNALWWFRWGAMFTFLTGWTIIITHMVAGTGSMAYYALVLTGGTMGTLMWFNVWFVIWPIQQGLIANAEAAAAGGQADEAAAAKAPIAARASRTNTLFSLPMLFFMGAARHLTIVDKAEPSYGPYLGAMLVIVLLVEANIWAGPPATQKPLGSVSGTIHFGLGLTVVLFLVATIML
ncbi:MAG: urate hydroxylase PuuD [Deltaproteobacteria bacterium]|nr:urate hydroxylase PuuD [Deltaproteobacteria bacterium]